MNGTLNDPSDTDKGWSVEVAIPRFALQELKFRTEESSIPSQWRMNFSRVEWDHQIIGGKYGRKKDKNGKLLPEHNWVWSPQGVIDMHQTGILGIYNV